MKLSVGRECRDPNIYIKSRCLSVLEIANLYADAYIFLSSYEGFGIPVIDAIVSRCPVIIARNTACEKVSGSFFRLVLATVTNGLRHEMESLIGVFWSDHQLDSAARHVFNFSLERYALKYYSVFKKATTSHL